MVGCPAKGSSVPGVKILSRAVLPGSSGLSTNTVSDRFISFAIACMRSAGIPSAASTTASWLPARALSVKTSTVLIR